MIFYLDGEQVGTYVFNFVASDSANSEYHYSVPVFQLGSLPDENHTFVLSNGRDGPSDGHVSVVIFDSIQYTLVSSMEP